MPAQITQNVVIDGRRTSIRLDRSIHSAVREICAREGITVHAFCSMVRVRHAGLGLTAAVRAAAVDYFREALERAESGESDLAASTGVESVTVVSPV